MFGWFKKKTKWVLPGIVVAAVGIYLAVGVTGEKPRLFRVNLDRLDGGKEKDSDFSYTGKEFSITKSAPYWYVKKTRHAVSVPGIAFDGERLKNRDRSIQVKPGVEGKYFLDFYYLLSAAGENLSPLHIVHRREEKTLKRIRLPATDSVKRKQVALALKKGDVVQFVLRTGGIEAGLVSSPVFYRFDEETAAERNFVFIVVADTLRRDHLGVYDSRKKCSPSIDLLARDAVTFDSAYSTSPWTLPAHMSLFTGQNPDRHRVNYGDRQLDRKVKVLFEALQQKFTSYSLNADGYMSGLYGFCRGFDYCDENFRDHRSRTASRDLFARAGKFVLAEKHRNALFLLHTYQVHTPYLPEIPLAREYDPQTPDKVTFDPIAYIKNGKELFKKASEEEIEKIVKIYDAGIYTFDRRFGEFIAFLKDRKIYRDATIIFLSDHGEEFNDHGAWEHGHSLYNELIKIPLVVKFPGNRYAGMRIERPVCITDVVPTVLELYGIENGEDIRGISLLKAVKAGGKPGEEERPIFSFLAGNSLRTGIPEKVAVISGRLKYIFQAPMTAKDKDYFTIPPPPLKNLMFDLSRDAGESHNIRIRRRKEEKKFLELIKRISLERGKKGHLKALEETLKSMGYL